MAPFRGLRALPLLCIAGAAPDHAEPAPHLRRSDDRGSRGRATSALFEPSSARVLSEGAVPSVGRAARKGVCETCTYLDVSISRSSPMPARPDLPERMDPPRGRCPRAARRRADRPDGRIRTRGHRPGRPQDAVHLRPGTFRAAPATGTGRRQDGPCPAAAAGTAARESEMRRAAHGHGPSGPSGRRSLRGASRDMYISAYLHASICMVPHVHASRHPMGACPDRPTCLPSSSHLPPLFRVP